MDRPRCGRGARGADRVGGLVRTLDPAGCRAAVFRRTHHGTSACGRCSARASAWSPAGRPSAGFISRSPRGGRRRIVTHMSRRTPHRPGADPSREEEPPALAEAEASVPGGELLVTRLQVGGASVGLDALDERRQQGIPDAAPLRLRSHADGAEVPVRLVWLGAAVPTSAAIHSTPRARPRGRWPLPPARSGARGSDGIPETRPRPLPRLCRRGAPPAPRSSVVSR